MHSTEIGGNTVPAFITKLWKLVEDPNQSDLICWNPNGQSFIIHDQAKFAKELLPLYFKHNNMASFIRQLNMYGFRKVLNIEQGRLRGGERDDVEFFHQFFVKGKMECLEFIKRKVPSSRTIVSSSAGTANNVGETKEDRVHASPESIQDILSTMSNLKNKQGDVDSRLNSLKQENESLWREVAYLRQKHLKQQQIVNKLIHFLVTLVQPNRNISVKRKLPLMLEDGSPTHTGKVPRLSRQFSNHNSVSLCSPNGPVIHDVTDILSSSPQPGNLDDDEFSMSPRISAIETPPEVFVPSPLVTEEHMEPLFNLDPLHSLEPLEQPDGMLNTQQKEEPAAQANELLEEVSKPTSTQTESSAKNDHTKRSEGSFKESDMQIALSGNQLSMDKLSDHLDGVETELSWLQEQLSNGTTLNLDTSALFGLFSSDDLITGSNIPTEPVAFPVGDITGNELMQYVPSLLDFEAIEEELPSDGSIPSTSNLDTLLQTPEIQNEPPFYSFEK